MATFAGTPVCEGSASPAGHLPCAAVLLDPQAGQSHHRKFFDDAMVGIERGAPSLNGMLSREYARPTLDKQRLGQLIDLAGNVRVGQRAGPLRDVPVRLYEYSL